MSCFCRPAPPARRAALIALLLLTALIARPAVWGQLAAGGENSLTAARAGLDAEFLRQLEQLAAKCDELEMQEQARVTRDWFIRRDPRRQYVFTVPDSDPTAPAANAPQLVQFWHRKFAELRREQAKGLFEMARRAVSEDRPTLAFQWLHEVLREDPHHAEARQVLGYQRVGEAWRAPFRQPRAVSAGVSHPQFGWARRRYWRVDTGHYRITTNHSAEAGLALGAQLEDLCAVWRQLFFRYWSSRDALVSRLAGGAPLDQPGQHNVVLFRDRDEYLAQLRRAEPQIDLSVGYYLDKRRTAYFYVGDDPNPATWRHEATHQLFHETPSVSPRVGETSNFWIVEGVALYMESLCKRDGYFTVGGSDANRLQFARYRALNEGFYTPLEKLVRYGRRSLQEDENIRSLYSQAAGLAGFLMDFDGGRYRQAAGDLLRRVYQGRDEERTLAALANVSYSELDAQYRQFLNVTDADLEHLRPPPHVRNLSLGHTAVTDKGLARLADHAELEWLDLAAAKVTDAGVSHLKSMSRLRQLNLEQTLITDEALETIGGLDGLEDLDLSATRLTDAGLAHLARLTNLKVLWLTSTRVTDAGLEHLQNLKQLEKLETSGTQVTPGGLQRLKQHLPSLRESG